MRQPRSGRGASVLARVVADWMPGVMDTVLHLGFTDKAVEGRAKLLPFQRTDFIGIFTAMDGLPVTVRLLDPPLHEFVPHDEKQQSELARFWSACERRKGKALVRFCIIHSLTMFQSRLAPPTRACSCVTMARRGCSLRTTLAEARVRETCATSRPARALVSSISLTSTDATGSSMSSIASNPAISAEVRVRRLAITLNSIGMLIEAVRGMNPSCATNARRNSETSAAMASSGVGAMQFPGDASKEARAHQRSEANRPIGSPGAAETSCPPQQRQIESLLGEAPRQHVECWRIDHLARAACHRSGLLP